MAVISDVIEFNGNVDDLVWKSPVENFNTTSVLIVDETHKALVTVNGVQYGLYEAGRHVLDTPNLPGGRNIVDMPTGRKSSFPCKVFYINMLHQMSMEWGIPGNIKLEDPVYEIFMDIGARGTVNFVVTEPIKFVEKLVGFRDQFSPEELTDLDHGKFRGIINKWVTSDISKIMISGGISYFTISENLFEISEVLKEQLSGVFGEYGIGVQDFTIEAVVANAENTAALSEAKQKHASRKVQGYTWQDERKMTILETAAGNSGALGGMQGAVGGFMMGGAIGGSLSDMVRDVLNMNSGSGAGAGQGEGPVPGRGAYNHIDPISFLKNGAGKPTINDPANKPAQQPTGVSFSDPQPADGTSPDPQPTGVSFADPQPADGASPDPQPTGVSFADPQPAGASFSDPQPTGVSFADPQPAGASFSDPQPTGVSFADPQPTGASFSDPQPTGVSFADPQPTGVSFSDPQPAPQEKVEPAPEPASYPEIPQEKADQPVETTDPVPVRMKPETQNTPAASKEQDDKKVCGGCGRMVSKEFLFCPYCRYSFPKTCPHCGNVVEDDFAFCPYCSTPLH